MITLRTFKSNSGRIRVAALAALVSLSAAASGYAPVEFNGTRLQLQLVEMNKDFYGRILDITNEKPFFIAPKENISDFIVADGRFYFGAPRTGSRYPMFITRVDGVLNGSDNTTTGKILILNANEASGELGVKNYTYLGTDSHGNSYLSTINEAGGPVLVFPLDISEDGEVTLAGRYELQCDQGKYAAKVYVSGDITTGDFEATALLRDEVWPFFNENDCAGHNRWIGHWTVAGNEQTHFVNELRTTYASISYIPDTGSFLLDDNGRYAEPGKWEFETTSQAGYVTTTPSVCHFENGQFIVDSGLPDVAEGTFHAGAAVFALAGYNIVVYNTTPGKPAYRIAVLSGCGTSRGATAEVTPLWTLAEDFSGPDNTASAWTNEHNNAHIYAVPSPEGNAADLYIASNQKDMAHYRISCNGSSTSEMPVTATGSGSDDPQYCDLAGRTVITPALPGIYLERRGSTVRKLIVR